jgi:hypothetical protein
MGHEGATTRLMAGEPDDLGVQRLELSVDGVDHAQGYVEHLPSCR